MMEILVCPVGSVEVEPPERWRMNIPAVAAEAVIRAEGPQPQMMMPMTWCVGEGEEARLSTNQTSSQSMGRGGSMMTTEQ